MNSHFFSFSDCFPMAVTNQKLQVLEQMSNFQIQKRGIAQGVLDVIIDF